MHKIKFTCVFAVINALPIVGNALVSITWGSFKNLNLLCKTSPDIAGMLLIVSVRCLATVVTQLSVYIGVVPEQLIQTASEREDDEDVEEEELYDVVYHSAKGYLQWAEVVVDGEDVD